MHLTWIDYSILAIIVISVLIGLIRGFLREALSLVFWVLAVWIGIVFIDIPVPWLQHYIPSQTLSTIASFFLLFFLTLIVGAILGAILSIFVEKTGLTGTDRMLGIIFGAGRGALLVGLLLLFGTMVDLQKSNVWSHSVLVPQFQPLVIWLHGFLPKEFLQPLDK